MAEFRVEWAVWQQRTGVEDSACAAVKAVEALLSAAQRGEDLAGQVLVLGPPIIGQRRFLGGSGRQPGVLVPPVCRRRAWREADIDGRVHVMWGRWSEESQTG